MSLAPLRALRGASLVVLALLAGAPQAGAQFSGEPWTGTQPTKTISGAQLQWNGTGWQTPPGTTVRWSIHIVNDIEDPAVSIDLVDDIPDPADGDPVAAFDIVNDVVAQPAVGALSYTGDWLQLQESPLLLGQSFDLDFLTHVNAGAPPGTEICNRALVTYVEADASGEPVASIPMRWRSWTENGEGDAAPTCFTVAAVAPLLSESSKTAVDADGDGQLSPGETVTYTIVVRNTGNAPARNIVVTDALAAPLAVVAVGQGGTAAGTDVTWNATTTPALGRVNPGASTTLTLTARLDGCPSTTTICNQALLSSDEIATPVATDADPSDGTPQEPTCLPVARPELAGSPLAVTDAGGDGTFTGGEGVTWQLDVTNTGPVAALDVTVRLPLPAEVTGAAAGQGGTVTGGEARWDATSTPALASIASGSSVTLTVTGTVDPLVADGATACAQAQMAPGGCAEEASDDPVTGAVLDPTCFVAVNRPELAVTVLATDASGDGTLEVGEEVEYTVVAEVLSGAPAIDATVELQLPGGGLLDGVTADDGGVVAPTTVTWTSATTPSLSSIAVGGSVSLVARGTLGCLALDASTACAGGQLDAANAAAPVSVVTPTCLPTAAPQLQGSPLLAADASGDGTFEAGEAATLELSLTNRGSVAAHDVTVTLPLLAADLDVVASDGGLVLADRVEWTSTTTPALVAVSPGPPVTLTVSLRIDPTAGGTRSCHQAEIGWTGHDPCAAELSDDPLAAGAVEPTCWNVDGSGLPPGEVPDGDPAGGGPIPVRLSCAGDDLVLTWAAAPRADTHAVYRAPLSALRATPWTNPAAPITDPENAAPSCDLPVLTYTDEAECATGRENWYYLVAGRNVVGEGPIGEELRGGAFVPRPPPETPCP